MAAWPNTIPQTLNMDGYGEAARDTNIRSAMDAGPAKVRRRASCAVRPVTGKMVMTAAELDDFREFYEEDILDGSLRFDWVDPLDGTTAVEMRFTAPYTIAAFGPDAFEVGMSLEILP
jgi:hypothetical protein